MSQSISLITLGVSDIARSRSFYEELGYEADPGSNDNVVFFPLSSGVTLGLYSEVELSEDCTLTDPRPGGITLALNMTSRNDVDQKLSQAEKIGGTILKAGFQASWGGYTGYFADPDGHPWEVTYAPMFNLRENGTIDFGDSSQ